MVMPRRSVLLLLVTNWLLPDQIRAVLLSSSADEPRLTGNLREKSMYVLFLICLFLDGPWERGVSDSELRNPKKKKKTILFLLVIPLSKMKWREDRTNK